MESRDPIPRLRLLRGTPTRRCRINPISLAKSRHVDTTGSTPVGTLIEDAFVASRCDA
jgi:hypothetical protein